MTVTEFDFCIIGAGIIGAAVAYRIRELGSVCILEKNAQPCLETSGNNSGVIHPGFNHPPDSLKGKLCVQGNALLYEYCSRKGIPHLRCGTYVIAFTGDDERSLERIAQNAAELGMKLERRMPERAHSSARAALFAPSGGVVDVPRLCQSLIEESNADLRCNDLVTGIEYGNERWRIRTKEGSMLCNVLINAAGLYSDEIASMVGYPGYKIYPCSGEYYEIVGWTAPHLYYPAPHEGASIGLHLSPTLRNTTLIGPSAAYLKSKTDAARFYYEEQFREAAELMFPGCTKHPVRMAHRGIRPKLSDSGFRDFVIRKEERPVIQLIGIESPGLTSCLAIAEMVRCAL